MTWAVWSDVQSRVPGRPIGDDTAPTSAQVTAWIAEAEAELRGVFLSAGMASDYTGQDALLMLRSWVCDYAEARVRMAYAAAGGDGNNDDGADAMERWATRLDKIRDNPEAYSSQLSDGSARVYVPKMRGSTPTTDRLFEMGKELF